MSTLGLHPRDPVASPSYDTWPLGNRIGPGFHEGVIVLSAVSPRSPRGPVHRTAELSSSSGTQSLSRTEGRGRFSASASGGQGRWALGRERRSGLERFHREYVQGIPKAGIKSFSVPKDPGAAAGLLVQRDHRVWESRRTDPAGQSCNPGSSPHSECSLASKAFPLWTVII